MKNLCVLAVFLLSSIFVSLTAQINVNGNLLFGNEWVDYEKEYYKIIVSEDGIYRLSFDDLQSAGFPITSVEASSLQLFHFGNLVPLRASTSGILSSGDFVEFMGKKNRGEFDKHLYVDSINHLNPEYSLYNDESAYFLTWTDNLAQTRIMEEVVTDLTGSVPPAEVFYEAEELLVFSNEVLKASSTGDTRPSSFRNAEGFASGLRNQTVMNIPVSNLYDLGTTPKIDIRLSGNLNSHFAELSMNGSVLKLNSFQGNGISSFNENIGLDQLRDDNSFVITGNHSGSDFLTVAYARLTYPREFKFDGTGTSTIKLDQSVFTRLLEIQEFDLSGNNVVAYDSNGAQYFPGVIEEGLVKILIPGGNESRELTVVNTREIKSVKGITKTSFFDYSQMNPEYIIISSTKFKSDSEPYLQDYADYRSSEQGGGFETGIVYIEDLFNQFAYGIDRHPLSVKNFANWFKSNWTNPKFIFIVGKGFEYPSYRNEEDFALTENQYYTVPTLGFPGSDNLLLSEGNSTVPIAPLGRLPIRELEDLRVYLNKVKEHEDESRLDQTIEDQLWRKRILHLSGGDTERLQDQIFSHLTDMEEVIESSNFGGSVKTFRKTNAQSIQTAETKELFDLINDGVSVITFFGHSSAGTFDFSLEQPSKYENQGKYPLILSLGCFSGNIHTSAVGISEDFVIEEDRGSIAFIAASGTGIPAPQYVTGRNLYDAIGNALYGESLGEALRNALSVRDSTAASNNYVLALNEQITLNGDPAVRLFANDSPDLTFDFESVKTEPGIVSTNLDSFEISFDLVNLGKSIEGDANINVKRLNPRGELVYEENFRKDIPGFSDNISLTLPTQGASYLGKNSLFLHVDDVEEIEERPDPAAEENNKLESAMGTEGFEFFVLDIGTRPVYPQEFSIIGEQGITLKASTNNLFVDEQKYIIQIDTTETFDSPFNQSFEKTQGGGLVEWKPEINYQNEQVYYWRVSPDSTNAEIGFIWNNSSFVYIENGPKGWNQSHYYQFLKDDFDGLDLPVNRQLQYDTSGFWISIHNQIYRGNESTTGYQFNFENFAAIVRPWEFMDGGMAVVVGNGTTGGGFGNTGGAFGSIPGGVDSDLVFGYDTNDPAQRQSMVSFLENEVNENDYVMIFSVLANENSTIGIENWGNDPGKTLLDVLSEQGASRIEELQSKGSVPYTFVYQKGKKVFHEDVADDIFEFIRTDFFLPRAGVNGNIVTDLIGPAASWDKLVFEEENKSGTDDTYFNVIGVDENENETLLYEDIRATDFDLSGIDADQYPYIKLQYFSEDQSQRTAAELGYWRIFFSRLPDAAVNPNAHFEFKGKNVQRGRDMQFEVAIENVSDIDMDSLLVKYTVVGRDNVSSVDYERLAPLPQGERIIAKYAKNTSDYQGAYQFTMEVNPDNDQKEEFKFNNFGIVEFQVGSDNKNPLLDVTFDGAHIMDFDLVAPKPVITLTVRDENEFLPINDISVFELSLENLTTGAFEDLDLDDPRLNFIPAQEGEENKAYLEFTPDLDEGEYKLIAQAQDASGNFSGENDYEVTFRVILKQSISNIMNYPNPFSTSTQFVFTLTGEVPQELSIQVMTLSGKVVRQITSDELGPLRVGNNITDYRWDGSDDLGQRLANGVYIYRLITKNANGEDIEKFEIESTNRFFNKDFGKLVIMR